MFSHKILLIIIICLLANFLQAQSTVKGIVTDTLGPVAYANVYLEGSNEGTTTNEEGKYTLENIPEGEQTIVVSFISYDHSSKKTTLNKNETTTINFQLKQHKYLVEEVVISGTLKPVIKSESPVPIEVYTPTFFKSNPTPSIYEAMSNVNGVRPQINCAVCNTGDIHINGLEGAYTMVLIDGMPIVSGLSTVYGLFGIPQSLIERVEIVKGPAATLYGSESVGGLINVITKKTANAPIISAESFASTWGEVNTDIATKLNLGKKVEALIGMNYFNYGNRIDKDGDNFTDLTLQNRISLFNKWTIKRKSNKAFSLAGRYVYEDRFGGDMNWQLRHRGTDILYGESIYTSRLEILGTYQLPFKEKVMLTFSANEHDQNSVYGNTEYIADQKIAFGQLTWNKRAGKNHHLLLGTAIRYTYYDDNTPATASSDDISVNNPDNTFLPGIFIQDELLINKYNKLLLGMRYDYNSRHGNIFTPRFNFKKTSKNKKNILRLSAGSGYRVANIFTEDHAALTGSRDVVFISDLKPETSWNGNINYVKKVYTKKNTYIGFDISGFYTYFNNKIFPDYDTNPNKIIYDNLNGYAVSAGVSFNIEILHKNLSIITGATAMDVYSVENNKRARQELTEQYSGTWSVQYAWKKRNVDFDYTGNLYGPMLLPTLGENDPRPEYSPWWSIQNLQITKKYNKNFEIFGGVKNLLNWLPTKKLGEVGWITRTNDPFDKNVQFDQEGNALVSANNPYGLTFDASYVFAPNQGRRGFFGLRYTFDK